jgi:hypothetical protein
MERPTTPFNTIRWKTPLKVIVSKESFYFKVRNPVHPTTNMRILMFLKQQLGHMATISALVVSETQHPDPLVVCVTCKMRWNAPWKNMPADIRHNQACNALERGNPQR